MPLLPHGFEALKLDPFAASLAGRGEVLLPTEFAVQLRVQVNKSDLHEVPLATPTLEVTRAEEFVGR